MLFALFLVLLINNSCYCDDKILSEKSSDISNRKKDSPSIVPSPLYQYYENEHDDYSLPEFEAHRLKDGNENSGFIYSKPYALTPPKNSDKDNTVPTNYPTNLPTTYEVTVDSSYKDPVPVTNNNFYYYYTVPTPSQQDGEHVYSSSSTPSATNFPEVTPKYKGMSSYEYNSQNNEQPHPDYNPYEHYHLDDAPALGRQALLPPPLSGPGPSGPFLGPPGPSGPLPPPPPPPVIKGSIDYILIPLILIGIAGPIFVVLYVILGAFEAKLAPIVRSLSGSGKWNFSKVNVDQIMSTLSKAMEKYGY